MITHYAYHPYAPWAYDYIKNAVLALAEKRSENRPTAPRRVLNLRRSIHLEININDYASLFSRWFSKGLNSASRGRVGKGGKEERKGKKLLARHTQWNVYVWNDAPRAVKDKFSETPVNRTDYKRCLFALHYITLHYVTLHYI